MDPAEKERRIIALISQLRPKLQAAGVDPSYLEDYATHSERGLALEDLIWAVSEHAVLIGAEQYGQIDLLGMAMGMSPSIWQSLDDKGLVQARHHKAPD